MSESLKTRKFDNPSKLENVRIGYFQNVGILEEFRNWTYLKLMKPEYVRILITKKLSLGKAERGCREAHGLSNQPQPLA